MHTILTTGHTSYLYTRVQRARRVPLLQMLQRQRTVADLMAGVDICSDHEAINDVCAGQVRADRVCRSTNPGTCPCTLWAFSHRCTTRNTLNMANNVYQQAAVVLFCKTTEICNCPSSQVTGTAEQPPAQAGGCKTRFDVRWCTLPTTI